VFCRGNYLILNVMKKVVATKVSDELYDKISAKANGNISAYLHSLIEVDLNLATPITVTPGHIWDRVEAYSPSGRPRRVTGLDHSKDVKLVIVPKDVQEEG